MTDNSKKPKKSQKFEKKTSAMSIAPKIKIGDQDIPAVWVDELAAAGILDCGLSSLRNARFLGKGIPYVKRGRSVRYFLPDLYSHMENRKIIPPAGRE